MTTNVAGISMATTSDQRYFPYFDYLRIVLASIVMLAHDEVITLPHAGTFAVQVFFALSGWLIGSILLGLETRDLPRFYMNRAVRIWVPYFLAFVLLLAASLLKDRLSLKWLEFMTYKAFFVYNLFGSPQIDAYRELSPLRGTGNHFWSVNAEEQFYLLAPLLLVVAAKSFGRSVLFWVGIALTAWLTNTYASIVFGVLAAVVVHRYGPVHRQPILRLIWLASAIVFGAGLAYGGDFWLLTPFIATAVVLFLAVEGKQTPLGKFVGGISYPLYLNHWIGVFAGNYLLSPFGLRDAPVRKVVSVVLSISIASALYWFVDRKILARRAAWYTVGRARTTTIFAYGLVILGLMVGFMVTGGKQAELS